MICKPKYLEIYIISIIAFIYYFILKLHQYQAFGIHGELADFESMIWNTLQGRFLEKGATNLSFFAIHFSPILLLLVPVYAVFSSPISLLVVQAGAVATALIPLYFIARDRLTNGWVSIAIVLSFLFSRMVNYGLMYDFHMEIFYPLLLFCVFWSLQQERWTPFFIFLVLAFMVKEDAGVAFLGLGLYMVSIRYYRQGIIVTTTSLIYLLAIILIIIPQFRASQDNGSYLFAHYWANYGNSIREIIGNMMNPIYDIKAIFTLQKIQKMFNLFSVFLFLPLFSLRTALFLVLPCWFMLYSTDNKMMNGYLTYYGLLIIPFLFYSSINVLSGIQKRFSRHGPKIVTVVATTVLIINIGNSAVFKQMKSNYWEIHPRVRTAQQLIDSIPKSEPVSVQVDLQSHIPVRLERYLIPNGIDRAHYLLFDSQGNTWPLSKDQNNRLLDSLRNSKGWEILAEKDGFVLMHSGK